MTADVTRELSSQHNVGDAAEFLDVVHDHSAVNGDDESTIRRRIQKDDFLRMGVIGQFNLGFELLPAVHISQRLTIAHQVHYCPA